MDKQEQIAYYNSQLIQALDDKKKWESENLGYTLFPKSGPFGRDKYPQIWQCFAAGKDHAQRALIAPNRSGKTYAGGYETYLHLSGNYPDDWPGKKFLHPIDAWACGKTGDTVRDILQITLLGKPGAYGTGIIPKHLLKESPPKKQGISEGISTVYVEHRTNGVVDGLSRLVFKAYEVKRKGFEGTAQHWIWLDEEAPDDIYTECLTRTMTTNGHILLTFTPLDGMTDCVLRFFPCGQLPDVDSQVGDKWVINWSWDQHIPHLSEEEKKKKMAEYSPLEIEARTRGLPSVGQGLIYPILNKDLEIEPFEIPAKWPRFYGVDWGVQRSAAVFFAVDPNTDKLYIYDVWESKREVPDIHVAELKQLGATWMYGASESSGLIYKSDSVMQVIPAYIELGLVLIKADKSWHAGIQKVWQYMATGRLKVFKHLQAFFAEKNLYSLDKDNKETSLRHDWMDAMRYGIMSGIPYATVNPEFIDEEIRENRIIRERNPVTGY